MRPNGRVSKLNWVFLKCRACQSAHFGCWAWTGNGEIAREPGMSVSNCPLRAAAGISGQGRNKRSEVSSASDLNLEPSA